MLKDNVILPATGELELQELEGDTFDTVSKVSSCPHTLWPTDKQWKSLHPLFGWLDENVIKKAFNCTTQLAQMPQSKWLKSHYKLLNPALNVLCYDETIATDTVFSNISGIFGGDTATQTYVVMTTQASSIKSEKLFVNTLEDIAAPSKFVSNHEQVETSEKVKNTLHTFIISSWQSEPHQHQHSCAEEQYQTMVYLVNLFLDCTGAPPNLWLEALKYVCYLLDHTHNLPIDDISKEN